MIRRSLIAAGIVLLALAVPTAVSAQPYGAPGITADAPLVPGATVTLTACCFEPGTPVTFSAESGEPGPPSDSPIASATVVAGPDGVAKLTTVVPTVAQPGTVVIAAEGTTLPGYGPAPDAPLPILPAPAATTTTPPVPGAVPTPTDAVAAESIEADTAAEAEAAARAAPGQLPVTGTELARSLSLVALVLIAGGGAVLVARRRHMADDT